MNKKLAVAALLTAVSGATFVTVPAQAQENEKRYCDYPLVNPELLQTECINIVPAGAPYTS